MPSMRITKEEFVYVMKSIEEQLKIDIDNNKAFSTLLKDDFVSNVENKLYESLLFLLEQLTNDAVNKWINHFVYELDFGKENYRSKVYAKDGKEIPLTTVEDLWNILSKE